jgi:hypothetical protein
VRWNLSEQRYSGKPDGRAGTPRKRNSEIQKLRISELFRFSGTQEFR